MVKRALVILACFVVLLNSNTSAQFIQSIDSKKIDSLELMLPGSEGKARIDLLNELAELYAWYDPKKAEIYSNEALESSIKDEYLVGEGHALFTIGYRKHLAGDPLGGSDYLQQAIDIVEQTNNYYLLGRIYWQLASVLFQDGNEKEKALEYNPKITELLRKAGAKKDEAVGYLILCGGYQRLRQYETALGYLDKFWELSKEVSLSNIYFTDAYTIAGQCYFEMGKSDTAIFLIKKAIAQSDADVFEEIALKSGKESSLGYFYLMSNELDSAGKYLYQSLETSRSIGSAYGKMKASRYLAYMHYLQSDYDQCINYCDSAIHISSYIDSTGSYYYNDSLKHAIAVGEDIAFPISELRRRYYAWIASYNCYNMLWDSYLAIGEKEKAIQIQKPWMDILDSIYTYQRNKSILAVNVSYQTEKKEQELARLEKDNQLKEMRLRQSNWVIAGLGFVVLLIGFMAIILTRQNRLKNSQQTLLFQQRLLRTQMNPHFLFNSLASIQNFIIKEKPALASDYLSRFSKLVRQILKNSVEEWITLEDEISSIKNYLELQKVRYPDLFDYTIEIDEAIDTETILVPPMLAQPFIENAIEHGFKHKEGKGHMKIQFKKHGKLIRFDLEDDGIGRDKAMQILKSQNTKHHSMSTEITRQRLKVLSKKTRQKIILSIIDLKDEDGNSTGTNVIFDLPFRD